MKDKQWLDALASELTNLIPAEVVAGSGRDAMAYMNGRYEARGIDPDVFKNWVLELGERHAHTFLAMIAAGIDPVEVIAICFTTGADVGFEVGYRLAMETDTTLNGED